MLVLGILKIRNVVGDPVIIHADTIENGYGVKLVEVENTYLPEYKDRGEPDSNHPRVFGAKRRVDEEENRERSKCEE